MDNHFEAEAGTNVLSFRPILCELHPFAQACMMRCDGSYVPVRGRLFCLKLWWLLTDLNYGPDDYEVDDTSVSPAVYVDLGALCERINNTRCIDSYSWQKRCTQRVAETITHYLKRTDSMAKTIVFCNGIDHGDRMRRAIANLNPEQMAKNEKYVMTITGDDELDPHRLIINGTPNMMEWLPR